MLILSRVCADFHDRSGRRLFAVTPANLSISQVELDKLSADGTI